MDIFFFLNIFPKISGSQEDNQISIFGCPHSFLVAVDTRTRKFCYPVPLLQTNTEGKNMIEITMNQTKVTPEGVIMLRLGSYRDLILGRRCTQH